jgi:hypothetical protein
MGCQRGKAAPDENTKLRLFSSSGGFCQNPGCRRPLFLDTGLRRIHVAEMAHIFAANDEGPRANKALSQAERGVFENLILLCSLCHTIADKAEEDYPDALIRNWKREHEEHVTRAFGAVKLKSRAEVLAMIEGPMQENLVIFEQISPDLDYREDPESEKAAAWQQKMVERIIPNNRRVLALLDINRDHMRREERRTLELFRQHIYDLEARHLTDIVVGGQLRFPEDMNLMMRPE